MEDDDARTSTLTNKVRRQDGEKKEKLLVE